MILFCHDGPINCDDDGRYFSIGFNDKLFNRYESVFGKIGIITRVDRSNGTYCFTEKDKLSVERYEIFEYPNYLTLGGVFKNKRQSDIKLNNIIAQCDALIIRLPSFLGSKCLTIATKLKKPYLVELVGCPWDSLRNHGVLGKILAPYMYFRTKKQVKSASHVLYVTDRFLQRRYPTNGQQIGCSDVELLKDETFDINKRVMKDFDPKNMVVGTLGQIALVYKGHATVIEAISRLKKQGINIKYQLVGPGDKSYLESVAKKYGVEDNVEFLGAMNHDDVFNWFDTLDLYIQPSLTEGMPRSLIEAMSRGCCCIASNAGGMPELLDNEFVFKKGNTADLIKIILSTNKECVLKQSKRNLSFSNKFHPDTLYQKRLGFYHEFKQHISLR